MFLLPQKILFFSNTILYKYYVIAEISMKQLKFYKIVVVCCS